MTPPLVFFWCVEKVCARALGKKRPLGDGERFIFPHGAHDAHDAHGGHARMPLPFPHSESPARPLGKSLEYLRSQQPSSPARSAASTGANLEALRRELYALDAAPSSKNAVPHFFSSSSAAKPPEHVLRLRRVIRALRSEPIIRPEAEVEFAHAWERVGNVVNYTAFSEFGEAYRDSVLAKHFTAKTFLKLPRNDKGEIQASQFFQYVQRRNFMLEGRRKLEAHDWACKGYLLSSELEDFIKKQMFHWPASSVADFCFTAMRKFKFMLDEKNRNRYDICDLVTSPEYKDLRRALYIETTTGQSEAVVNDSLQENWFGLWSLSNLNAVFWGLVGQDKSEGLLSKSDLLRYRGGNYLTPVFVDCMFETVPTRDGQLQYAEFLDLVIADGNRGCAQSLAYFWNILDTRRAGYLDADALRLFVRDVCRVAEEAELLTMNGPFVQDRQLVSWIICEVFDIVKPEHSDRITFKDLLRCKHGNVVVGIITVPTLFINYENREHILAEARRGEDPGEVVPA